MKILYVIETCGGGSGRHLLDLARGMHQQGNEVHIAFSPVRAEPKFLQALARLRGIRRFPVDMQTAPGSDDLKALRRLKHYIKHMGPFDIVHGHSSKGGGLARMAVGRNGAKTVYTPHALYTMNPSLSPIKQRLYGSIEKLLATMATDSIILVSEEEHEHARQQGLPEEKMTVIVNGVDTRPQAELAHTRQRVRARLGIADTTPVLGFVGRLDDQKAPERFIELAARLRLQRPDARFIMLGSGPKEALVRRIIKEYDLTAAVKLFTDASGDEFMPAFDLFVMTSRYEAMPYVLIEALAAQLPIISTNVGGAQTVIEEGVNGHIVPESNDVTPMLEKVSALLAQPEQLSAFAQASLEKSAKFQTDAMVHDTLNYYSAAGGPGT